MGMAYVPAPETPPNRRARRAAGAEFKRRAYKRLARQKLAAEIAERRDLARIEMPDGSVIEGDAAIKIKRRMAQRGEILAQDLKRLIEPFGFKLEDVDGIVIDPDRDEPAVEDRTLYLRALP